MSAQSVISFSRDSVGKEQRLREWRAQKGLLTEADREALYGPVSSTHHESEHRINRKEAFRHGYRIMGEIDSNESAGDVGYRGEEIIALAEQTGATAVLIPTLRRLGVGAAQVHLRKQIEEAGLEIIVTNPKYDAQNAILRSAPGPARDHELWKLAGADEYEWQVQKERLARARYNYWETAEGQAVLDFVAERPHLPLKQLVKALKFHRLLTPTGTTAWFPMTAARVRYRLEAQAKTANRAYESPANQRSNGQGPLPSTNFR